MQYYLGRVDLELMKLDLRVAISIPVFLSLCGEVCGTCSQQIFMDVEDQPIIAHKRLDRF